MMEMFQTKMASFEAELQKSSSTIPAASTSGLAADFCSFNIFVTHSLNALQSQIRMLSKTVDNLEMQGRRNMLMIHGVSEQENEDTSQAVIKVSTNSLKLEGFTLGCIQRCYRMGRPTAASMKPRPIIVKFQQVSLRDQVWFKKSKLKNSGVTLSEFLTHRATALLWRRERSMVSINAGLQRATYMFWAQTTLAVASMTSPSSMLRNSTRKSRLLLQNRQ